MKPAERFLSMNCRRAWSSTGGEGVETTGCERFVSFEVDLEVVGPMGRKGESILPAEDIGEVVILERHGGQIRRAGIIVVIVVENGIVGRNCPKTQEEQVRILGI